MDLNELCYVHNEFSFRSIRENFSLLLYYEYSEVLTSRGLRPYSVSWQCQHIPTFRAMACASFIHILQYYVQRPLHVTLYTPFNFKKKTCLYLSILIFFAILEWKILKLVVVCCCIWESFYYEQILYFVNPSEKKNIQILLIESMKFKKCVCTENFAVAWNGMKPFVMSSLGHI